jgi:uncharacterized protein (TIGR02246 family)
MSARTPEDLHRLWAEAFTSGDLDGLVALYEPDATMVPQPGHAVSGQAAIREALQGLLATKPVFKLDFRKALRAGDIALLFSRWTLSGKGTDGSEISLAGQTSDVARRQTDGSWLLVIDNPFGADGIE